MDKKNIKEHKIVQTYAEDMASVLENDKEIRALLEPWMVRLTKLMHTSSQAVKPPNVLRH